MLSSLANAARKVLGVFMREFRYVKPKPHTATLGLTERCNLKCKSCGVWQLPARKHDELDFAAIKKILHDLKTLGIIRVGLIDGEPLLRGDIVDIVNEITRLGMESEMTTNAALLKPDKARELVEAGLGRVMVSIDAPNEVHDELRGAKGSFDRATAGVRQLIAARQKLGCSTPTVLISSLLTRQNIGFVDQWLDLVCALGADGINFACPTFLRPEDHEAAVIDGKHVGSGRFLCFDDSLLIPPGEMKLLLPKLKAMRAEGKRRGIVVWLSPDLFLCDPGDFQKGRVPIRRCYFIRTNLIVSPYGEITPCALMDRYAYGSALNDPLKKIWLNDAHRTLLDKVDNGFELCGRCRCHFASNLTPLQQIKRKLLHRA
jgi:MoaA/NifB/PqqE/SkfB family radical SAM enzyme